MVIFSESLSFVVLLITSSVCLTVVFSQGVSGWTVTSLAYWVLVLVVSCGEKPTVKKGAGMVTQGKGCYWVCSFLVGTMTAVLIVDTRVVQREDSLLWVYTGKSGCVKRRAVGGMPGQSPTRVISQFQGYHSEWSPQ